MKSPFIAVHVKGLEMMVNLSLVRLIVYQSPSSKCTLVFDQYWGSPLDIDEPYSYIAECLQRVYV